MAFPRPNRTPRRDDLVLVEQILTDATRAPGHLGQAAAYLLERPGKRVRARLSIALSDSLQLQIY